jgi:DNA polymerase V
MKQYLAIDLKSFYASVECVDRGLDPLLTNLVVADTSRTDKTICLAVSPSLKAYGIGGRARLFEVVQRVREINFQHPDWHVSYIAAPPRMSRYIEASRSIYQIYLKYIAPEDIHVYSVDEVFMDVTGYLATYKMTAHQLAMKIIQDVLRTTGITATAGIGTNLYLAKVAMDIMAKKMPADKDGVRIASLDEQSYRRLLWNHRPLKDFWRVSNGITSRLAVYGIDTMGKIARMSEENEELLYKLFGVNAELLIDHAWGWEPCTIDDIKSYRPERHSYSQGQVLSSPYTFKQARVVVREMAESVALSLFAKRKVANQIILTVSYDRVSLTQTEAGKNYQGPIVKDYYGRVVPKHAHASHKLDQYTSSSSMIIDAVTALYDRIVNPDFFVRRLNVTVNNVVGEGMAKSDNAPRQLDLFTDYEKLSKERELQQQKQDKERRIQNAQILIKQRFGKNAILRGLNFEEGATARERNSQIGGHKA